MRLKMFLASLAIAAFVLSLGCGSGTVDYSKAPAQTGGPEQGIWQDKGGQKLELASGNFTYSKSDGTVVKGTYKVDGGNVAMTGVGGQAIIATYDTNGTISLYGSALTKTD